MTKCYTAGYKIEKHRGLWWLIDEEGYECNWVGYETKREAIEAAKVREEEDEEIWRRAEA